ncbi:alkyl hydroperoxide reductase [Elizabethkingia sp. YR214]|uniref:alkyl hydroperoxide reductase n=1 Tax=Elizabethkingia sp. YR214 TaxID=2135667 RepID=UPI000D30BFDC|nr:alkyl hydroperoxide reductase [Elizabethkingia sp. YR214]
MNFPKFSGKSYDFIIFQGSEQKTIIQGIIPTDGRFTLSIPKEYIPYIGMSRWLITGTKEGGGLDMYIPGHVFSVSCLSAEPNEKNIIYSNNTGNDQLNALKKVQDSILLRHQSMTMALRSYAKSSSYYKAFVREEQMQKKVFEVFQNGLKTKDNFVNNFFGIVNIENGITSILTENQKIKADEIVKYISQNLNWDTLYTSGYWANIIQTWIYIHCNVLKDAVRFEREFKIISDKIVLMDRYSDFFNKLNFYLKELNKSDYLEKINSVKRIDNCNNKQ